MSKPSLERVEELFHQAADLGPDQRSTFLSLQCAGDTELRAAVDDLLQHDAGIDKSADVLVSPIIRSPAEWMPAPLPADAIAGYEILHEIGRGGMGVVYKARQTALNRVVALKMLLSGATSTSLELARFRTEAEALARLQHPNIVQIYEIGEYDGRPYFAMEYVAGADLGHAQKGRPQAAIVAAQFVEQLARAMHAVHQCGIIHRDLKPANILLAQIQSSMSTCQNQSRGPGTLDLALWTPKITDFGLAKDQTIERHLTDTGLAMGTPCYMAPEQARGDLAALGPTTDIYALGVILYELVTGRPPFHGATALETLHRVLSEEPLPPRRLQPRLSRDLETICLKCVEKDPRRRYANAWKLAEDLRRFQSAEPIRARPIGLVARGWRWCRRRPAVAAMLAVSTLMAAATLTTVLVYNARLERALTQSKQQVVELNVTIGMNRLEEGDYLTALPWLTEALRRDAGNAEAEQRHRTRFATTLRQCPELLQLLALDQSVLCARPDPVDRVVTTGQDGVVRLWDTTTGEQIDAELNHPAAVQLAALSADGRFLGTACADASLRIWDMNTHTLVGKPLPSGGTVVQLSFDPDGRILLARLADLRIERWDRATSALMPLKQQLKGAPQLSALSDDGRWLLIVNAAHTARIWNSATGEAGSSPLQLTHRANAVAFSPDGRRVAFAGSDMAVRVWDVAAGKPVGAPLQHASRVTRMAFSPNGDRIVTADAGRTARVWQVQTGEMPLPTLMHEGAITQVRFSPDGRLLATCGIDNRARVWDAATGMALTPPLRHSGSVRDVMFSGDSQRVCVIGNDDVVRLWRLTSAAIASTPQPHDVESPRSTWSGNELAPGRRLIMLPDHDAVQVVEFRTGEPIGPPLRHGSQVTDARFSPDGNRVLTTSDDNTAQVWDAVTGDRVIPPLQHNGTVVSAAFSSDGSHIITASEDHTARVWDAATGEPLTPPLRHPQAVWSAGFSPGGNQATTFCADRISRTWDISPDNRPAHTLVQVAEALSGARIDANYGLLPLDASALRSTWERVRLDAQAR